MPAVEAIAIISIIAAVAAAIGVVFGIVVVAPRMVRGLDRTDPPDNAEDSKEPGDRLD